MEMTPHDFIYSIYIIYNNNMLNTISLNISEKDTWKSGD